MRTPLNHIINYLELALDGQLDTETRENLSRSHMASKSLLFTINDLLDLTRIESGNETAFNDPFDLRQCIADATKVYQGEAKRRRLEFVVDLSAAPDCLVLGDHKKVRTVVANLVANAGECLHIPWMLPSLTFSLHAPSEIYIHRQNSH